MLILRFGKVVRQFVAVAVNEVDGSAHGQFHLGDVPGERGEERRGHTVCFLGDIKWLLLLQIPKAAAHFRGTVSGVESTHSGRRLHINRLVHERCCGLSLCIKHGVLFVLKTRDIAEIRCQRVVEFKFENCL